jgi:hypothetical protein
MLISHKKVGEEVVQRVTEDGTKGCDGGGLTGWRRWLSKWKGDVTAWEGCCYM